MNSVAVRFAFSILLAVAALALLTGCGEPRAVEQSAPAASPSAAAALVTPVEAGDYWFTPMVCRSMGGVHISWCVDRITVEADQMVVQLRGIVPRPGFAGEVEYGGGGSNRNTYLMDESGRRYDCVATSGAAKTGGKLKEHGSLVLGFVFPPPAPGARVFAFRDDDGHIAVNALRLDPSSRVDPKRYADPERRESLRKLFASVDRISLVDSWSGYTPTSPHVVHYTLRKAKGGWSGEASYQVRDLTKTQRLEPQSQMVMEFLRQLGDSPLVQGTYVPNFTHTDDQPELRFELIAAGETVAFHTSSQGIGHAPWAAEFGGRTWVVPSDAPQSALDDLKARLNPDETKVMNGLVNQVQGRSGRSLR